MTKVKYPKHELLEVDAILDSERDARVLTVLQLFAKFVLRHDFFDAAGDDLQLFVNGRERHGHQ